MGQIKFRFLGVGGASQIDLGHASAVLEVDDGRLLIDCGPGTTQKFLTHYKCLPDAVFITHCHLDHIADLENLFIKSWFHKPEPHRAKLFVPVSLLELLHDRVANYPKVLAEGGVNFWQAFELIPVSTHFEWSALEFKVHEVRHHAPKFAFGLHLPSVFFYTGDTRPIPELLNSIDDGETIFHDCGVESNPSHTGIEDLLREYSKALLQRIHCYHYTSQSEKQLFLNKQLNVVEPGQCFDFTRGSLSTNSE